MLPAAVAVKNMNSHELSLPVLPLSLSLPLLLRPLSFRNPQAGGGSGGKTSNKLADISNAHINDSITCDHFFIIIALLK